MGLEARKPRGEAGRICRTWDLMRVASREVWGALRRTEHLGEASLGKEDDFMFEQMDLSGSAPMGGDIQLLWGMLP